MADPIEKGIEIIFPVIDSLVEPIIDILKFMEKGDGPVMAEHACST